MHQTIVARHKSHSAPTYMLRFNFDSSYSFTKTMFAGRNIPGIYFYWQNVVAKNKHNKKLHFCFPSNKKVFVMLTTWLTTLNQYIQGYCHPTRQTNGKRSNEWPSCLLHSPKREIRIMTSLRRYNGNQPHLKRRTTETCTNVWILLKKWHLLTHRKLIVCTIGIS